MKTVGTLKRQSYSIKSAQLRPFSCKLSKVKFLFFDKTCYA